MYVMTRGVNGAGLTRTWGSIPIYSSDRNGEKELIFVSLPTIGYLVSMVEFGKLLIARDHHQRLSITIIVLNFPLGTKAFTYIESIAIDASASDVRFLDLPGLRLHLINSLRNRTHFRRIAGFVFDMFCNAIVDVAKEFDVPIYFFYTSSAASKDSETDISGPGYHNPVPVKLWPFPFFDKSGMIFNYTRRFKAAKGILLNTFLDLEFLAIEALSIHKNVPPIYPVGPIINLTGLNGSRNQEIDTIMKWLDYQPPNSVIFLIFGSPSPKGHHEYPNEYEDVGEVLPEGFLQRTAGKGKVIGWAPQMEVLSNPAIRGFVSPCGWNSTLESVWFGVPMAVWPIYAEQQMNAFEVVKEMGIAVEIKMDLERT
ncbi:hypothetical protein M9H77_18149 [Catharanthus roseus]|uniref:Uncharacterized protein n=1 Tax=Catharanthus roseus TaxID=4058 RepID=A0ACC0B6L5_CATRO|nr:hypothetical protein M9H77_18149 [Catharanthus roseus]